MKKSVLLLSFILIISFKSTAQVLDYAKEVVGTLASDEYKGRGYVGNGDKLAAEYIRSEFEKIGLQTYSKNYTQTFTTPVNTFPNAILFKLNGKELMPGRDFLVGAGSPSIKGSFSTVSLSANDMLVDATFTEILSEATNKFIVIPPYDKSSFSKEENDRINAVISFLTYHENNPSKGTIVLSDSKLTWAGSTSLNPKPIFTVSTEAFNEELINVEVELKNKFYKEYKTQNILGYIEGTNTDSLIVLVAHYDHLGMMGKKATFNGANDNASGVAMLLSTAKYYAQNKPKYSTAFIAFGAEELGILGSKYFTENPLFELSRIKFLVNFDLTGTGEEGIQVVNGSVYQEKFNQLKKINADHNLLAEVKIRGAACNSDHCMFDRKDVPSFFIYTLGGIKAYHDIYDRLETLPLTEFEDYYRLILLFVESI
tara:strand:+ start:597 stop:1877 length:1281 start_codon:yes stop_codon:yes gene_type:complete